MRGNGGKVLLGLNRKIIGKRVKGVGKRI